MKYDNKHKESMFKFKSMFHGIKCTEIEKKVLQQTAVNCVPSRICVGVIMVAIIKRRQVNNGHSLTTITTGVEKQSV